MKIKTIKYLLILSILASIFLGYSLFKQMQINEAMIEKSYNTFYSHLLSTSMYLDRYLKEESNDKLIMAQQTAFAAMIESNSLDFYFRDYNYTKQRMSPFSYYMDEVLGAIVMSSGKSKDTIKNHLDDVNDLLSVMPRTMDKKIKTKKNILLKANEIYTKYN